MIEHNGSNMSMGMQKVIFLTRGILKKAPIYFIDEPFTSIDHHTRLLVQHMIDVETKGKTVIIITHDIEDLDHILDRIIPLHDPSVS
jgi:ABC-type transport system involved in cytochrome bd biosynthesis fused ATPase/permease subunit